MLWPDFGSFSMELNIAIFMMAAAVVWLAGGRLAIHAHVIAERSGLGEAFVGLVLLAVATSLPEIGRTISASAIGNAPLAVNSLFGGIVLQTAVLALADLAVAQKVLTYFAPKPVLLLQGALVVGLLGLAVGGMAAGEFLSLFQVGFWTLLLLGLYLFSLYLLKSYEGRGQWLPVEVPPELEIAEMEKKDRSGRHIQRSMREVYLRFGINSSVIFAAGVLLAQVGDVLALQTGLGAGFTGATLLALASALPEISATLAAVRLGAYSMAISNIFGTNALLVALLFLSDIFYRQGPVLEAVERSSIFAGAMGIVATCVYLVGLIERRNRVFFRMGIDSFIVLALYLGTLVLLYTLR